MFGGNFMRLELAGRQPPSEQNWERYARGNSGIFMSRGPVAMYSPFTDDLDIFFYSEWAHVMIQLDVGDFLKPCPQKQVWPFCRLCRKFLFPVMSHRPSCDHVKRLDLYGGAHTSEVRRFVQF